MIRAQIIGDVPHLFDCLRRGFRDVLKLFVRRARAACGHLAQQRTVFDDEQTLSESIVQLGGDSLSFGFVGVDQAARKLFLRRAAAFQMIKPKLVTYSYQTEKE